MDTKFGCLQTTIGSLPHKDAARACAIVTHYLKDIPAWPQLPRRSFRENMYAQYSEGFPGISATEAKTSVDRTQDLTRPLAQFYEDHLNNRFPNYGVSEDYAAGLHKFLALENLSCRAIKGQVTGPVTWGMTVTDETGKAILYDETLADVVPKFLRLKAMWMERELRRLCKDTIVFLDEPFMSAFGSVGMQLSRQQVVSLITETLSGLTGYKGIHCCGNTDWSLLLQTPVDIINFDAYAFAGSLAVYDREVKRFLGHGGVVAWGIVPTDAESVLKETPATLKDRLEEAMAPFTRDGIPFRTLVEQSLLTPACGLAPIGSEEAAERALELLTDLSKTMRQKYL